MKSALIKRTGWAAIAALLFTSLSAFTTPAGQSCNCDEDGDARLFIDGKEIKPEGMITLKKDNLILLEATGLQPNSEVYIKVKKAGIKWAEETYEVNQTGTVKEMLDVPEKELTVNCTVNYYEADGDFITAEFKLRID